MGRRELAKQETSIDGFVRNIISLYRTVAGPELTGIKSQWRLAPVNDDWIREQLAGIADSEVRERTFLTLEVLDRHSHIITKSTFRLAQADAERATQKAAP